jgi:hypothetical protein
MLAYAKKYISLGWHVLPLTPGTKQPFSRLAPKGVHSASNDLETINHWWTAEPTAGIGVAMLPSGLVTIDIDPRNGGFETMERLESVHGALVSDVLALTGGGGEHRVFYSGLVTGLPGKLGPGVDVKADGYICVEPSVHPNGKAYNWEGSSDPLEGYTPSTLPGWVRDLARGPFNAVPFVAASRLVDEKQVADLRQALSALDADDYHQWVNFGNALVELGQAGFMLWDEWSQKSAKYDPQAVTKKWRSFKPGHYQLESIFFAAQNIGWVNPASVEPVLEAKPVQAPADIDARAAVFEQQEAQALDYAQFLNLPGPMGECLQWMLRTAQRPQPMLAMSATISLFCTALSTRIASPTGLRTNLYLVGVAGTSAGKDHGRKCIARVLQAAHLETLIGGDEIASGAGLLSRVARCPRTIFQLDEFGLMLQAMRSKNAGSHLASIVRYLMQLYGCTDSVYRGAEYADQKMRARSDIDFPCVNMHATTTPDQFFSALGSADVTSGALNRMLVLVTPDGIVARQEPDSEEPPESVVRWVEAVQRLQCGMAGLTPSNPLRMGYDNGAKRLIGSFSEWLDAYYAKHKDSPQIPALWGRAYEFAVKIAMVHAMALHTDLEQLDQITRNNGLTVSEASMAFGIDFTRYFVARMEKEVTERMGDSEFGILVKECLRVIKKAGPRGLTGRELGRKCAAYDAKEPRYQDSIHVAMVRREDAQQVTFPSSSGRGKPRLAWVASDFLADTSLTSMDTHPFSPVDETALMATTSVSVND